MIDILKTSIFSSQNSLHMVLYIYIIGLKVIVFFFPSKACDKIICFCKYEAVVNAVQVKFPCIFNAFLSSH